MILQDDVTLCRDFVAKVERAISERPENLLSLFVSGLRNTTNKNFIQALRGGESWSQIAPRDIVHVCGLVWPVQLVSDFEWWLEMNTIPGPQPPRSDDAAVGNWVLRTQQTVWAHVPCLVEHPDEVECVKGYGKPSMGKDKGRFAIHFEP